MNCKNCFRREFQDVKNPTTPANNFAQQKLPEKRNRNKILEFLYFKLSGIVSNFQNFMHFSVHVFYG